MTSQQIKKDWEYIYDKYGGCEDMCGDVCNEELFIGLLKGTHTKVECFSHMMQRYYDIGPECYNSNFKEDKKVQKIFDRWIKAGLIEER